MVAVCDCSHGDGIRLRNINAHLDRRGNLSWAWGISLTAGLFSLGMIAASIFGFMKARNYSYQNQNHRNHSNHQRRHYEYRNEYDYERKFTMLLNLPTEIAVECLLGLNVRDLLEIIKANRRLHAIATHQKSPLRHRLKKRHILALSLDFRNSHREENPWQGRPNDGDDSNCPEDEDMRNWNEEITMNVNRKEVNDENWDGYSRWFTIRFWDKCCDKHCANKKVEYAADDIRYPEQLIEGIDDCFWPGDETIDIHIKHHNKEEALQNLRLFTHYFSSVYIIGDFNMKFEGDFSPWPVLKPFFVDNPSNIRCKLSVSLNNVKFDPDQFFDCPIFQKGFAGFSYGNVQAISDPSNKSLYNDVLKKTDDFNVYDNSAGAALDDDTLIRLFSNVPYLRLHAPDLGVTSNGLARLIKNYYENHLQFTCPNGFSVSRGEKHAYDLEDLVSLIPKEAVVRKTSRGYEEQTFDNSFEIDKLPALQG
ncbi:hypothetical protein WR25_04886 [Diploscapter pachys]|uniref:F-box domain-containing protein n=1 Tax=Diploscapter pachys TaxID=2018661 RepID=A0A2A2L1B9_9BILA|nr:hypothetical protein WR25_04886 [Diploscapter pachys]